MMDMDTKEQIFRKESLDRISSPEQLNDYLKVTNPGVWAVLAAVIFFIVGILIWSVFGRLTTTVTLDGKAEDGIITVACTSEQAKNLEPGMKEKIWDEESTIREWRNGHRNAQNLSSGRYLSGGGRHRKHQAIVIFILMKQEKLLSCAPLL